MQLEGMHRPGEITEKPSSISGLPNSDKTPAIVLDTNAVLDWRVFGEPGMQPLADALEAGRLRWIATRPMLDELGAVLARTRFERWQRQAELALTFAQGAATLCEVPCLPLAGHPVCSDRDDQKFIDLALAAPARWLVTRDKALLKLARAAARRGVTVCTPSNWMP